jgi:hypothetical protein
MKLYELELQMSTELRRLPQLPFWKAAGAILLEASRLYAPINPEPVRLLGREAIDVAAGVLSGETAADQVRDLAERWRELYDAIADEAGVGGGQLNFLSVMGDYTAELAGRVKLYECTGYLPKVFSMLPLELGGTYEDEASSPDEDAEVDDDWDSVKMIRQGIQVVARAETMPSETLFDLHRHVFGGDR